MQLPKSWLSFLTSFPIFNPISPVNEQDSHSLRQVTHISCDMDPIRMVTASHPPQGKEINHFLSQQQELQQPRSIRASTGLVRGGARGKVLKGLCRELLASRCAGSALLLALLLLLLLTLLLLLLLSAVCAALARLFWVRCKDPPNRPPAPTDPGCAARPPPSL